MTRKTSLETAVVRVKTIGIKKKKDYCNRGWKLSSTETKGRRVFKCKGAMIKMYWRMLVGRLINKMRPPVFAD